MRPLDWIVVAVVLVAAWFLVFKNGSGPSFAGYSWGGTPLFQSGNQLVNSSGQGQFYGPDIDPSSGAYVPPAV